MRGIAVNAGALGSRPPAMLAPREGGTTMRGIAVNAGASGMGLPAMLEPREEG